ncbi:hypothetical protein [Brevundimonas sp.]|uniref:hypothetical protein n=1 Tax=Brevundimonas sp. TaxID=1871086 RepID=UPI001A1A69AB|nr:hypothetical protein [Brevundimonas sp.]MBJ7486390.1 hypothetical protein [Brevundimonas sp.]
MTEPRDGGQRAILAGFFAFLAIGLLLVAAFVLFRVLVPMILEAHFLGSVFVASVAGLFGTLGLGLLAVFLFNRISRMIRD